MKRSVTVMNGGTLSSVPSADARTRNGLRKVTTVWLRQNFDWIVAETKRIVEKPGSREDQPKVRMLEVIWNKMIPDAREPNDNGEKGSNQVLIQIGGDLGERGIPVKATEP